jgi:alkanesulfonate monooxygenase SsuD/methylene tetrahydromethanopterin reductase-like flavin-dependent oxidoreductase (luciferase family)
MGPVNDLVTLAVAAEQGGWDGVFLWDHLQLVRAMRLDVHDPWVTLGAMAHATERIRLGPLVTPLPRRRPWVVAKQVMTLDHLSNGRAVLGVGLGFPADAEFESFGEIADDRTRAKQLDEGLAIVDACLRGGDVSYAGAHYKIDAAMNPACVQQPRPPIWVAGMWPGGRPFRRAAAWDGVVPIAADGEPLRPDAVAQVVAAVGGGRPGYDVVTAAHWEHSPAEYADVGVTWLVDSRWPDGDWLAQLTAAAHRGPSG